MKKKWFKSIFIMCCILLIIVGVIGYYFPITIGGKAIQIKENLEFDQILSEEEIGKDKKQLIELVESIHPAFVDGSDLSKYEEAKSHYIQATDREMAVGEFRYETGAYLAEQLDKLVSEYDFIETRRGVGLMQGLVFNKPVGEIISKALDKGLILINAGTHIIRFVPPLVITKENVDEMMSILRSCLEA